MANNAPGKHYRKGISLREIFKRFPDSDTAEAWFAKERWGGKPWCPYCGSENVQSGAKHKTMPYRCREKECAKRFSVKTGTVMQSSNLDYQVWAIAMFLMITNLKGVSSMKLHRDLDITQKTAWHLAHRLRECWDDKGGMPFFGPVEADETYFGGKVKNMSNKKRKEHTGRGPAGKTAVLGAKDRRSNSIKAGKVEHTDGDTLKGFVEGITDENSIVYTDDAPAYSGLKREHETVKHSISEYVRDQAHTNGIESFWSMAKRGYHGTYHHWSAKHTDRYINEFTGRHNVRVLDTEMQMAGMSWAMENKRLRYQDLIA